MTDQPTPEQLDPAGGGVGVPMRCKACFEADVTEVVEVRHGERGEPWVDSTILRCPKCKNTVGGTLADRLTYIRNAYDYKYFGDYELSEEQNDAVWSAKALAGLVPDLVAAAKCALGALTGNMDGDMDLGDPVEMLRAALAKVGDQPPETPV